MLSSMSETSLAAVQSQGTKRLSDGVPEATSILEVDGLSVRFGQSHVLKNFAFTVAERSVVANGAGKTVLLRALLGSIPLRGSVRWAPGTRIGYVPQKLDLERDVPMTGRDLLRARLALAGLATTIGTLIASWLQQETGPIIVLVAAGGFLLSLLVPRATAATRA